MLTINATKRDTKVNLDEIRAEGKIPAVFYGRKEDSTPVILDEVEFLKIYEEAGESTIISLKDGEEEHDALIHDIQWDAVSMKPLHVDIYVIEKGKKIEIDVPLVFVGESEAVEKMGGVLVKVMHELPIEAMPKDLPSEIEVDISSLVDFEAQIKAEDLNIPEGVELKVEPEEVVALVQEPKEEEEEPEEEMDLDSIEVEGKGKADEEGEGGDAGSEGGDSNEKSE
jgi:large subunit ribosomal protein L25